MPLIKMVEISGATHSSVYRRVALRPNKQCELKGVLKEVDEHVPWHVVFSVGVSPITTRLPLVLWSKTTVSQLGIYSIATEPI